MKKSKQFGFTVIELMIATAVFSMVLLICSIAIVSVGRMFYKAMITSRTQDITRKVANDISQSLQFSGDTPTFGSSVIGGVTVNYLCVGGTRYSYNTANSLGTGPGQLRHILWRDEVSGTCNSGRDLTAVNPGGTNGEELLSNDMRVSRLIPTISGEFTRINLVISYGSTTDLFVNPATLDTCISSDVGGQFCAVSQVNFSVKMRL